MLFLGADHRGYQLKFKIQSSKFKVKAKDVEIIDLGAYLLDWGDDYPTYAVAVAKKVQTDPENHRGVVICGSGVGMDIVANRFAGIRCALGLSPQQVRAARNDDNVNLLALAADFTTPETALEMVQVFLQTPFSGNKRYRQRIELIDKLTP